MAAALALTDGCRACRYLSIIVQHEVDNKLHVHACVVLSAHASSEGLPRAPVASYVLLMQIFPRANGPIRRSYPRYTTMVLQHLAHLVSGALVDLDTDRLIPSCMTDPASPDMGQERYEEVRCKRDCAI